MSRTDLPEPIWNAFHARSKTKGNSEGAVCEENGYIGIIFNGVYFQFCPEAGASTATRLSKLSKERLEKIAENHDWKPLFVEGKVTRQRRTRRRQRGCAKAMRSQHVCDATCDYGDPPCKRCKDTGRITVSKGDSEDCPNCA